MALSIRVTGADEYGQYLKCLVCGDPGAGKTRSSSTWPNPLLASINANLMSIADRQVPYVSIHTSADLLQLRHTLDNPPEVRAELIGKPVDTLVIDTIDHFQQILAHERKRDEKKDVLSASDWGWLGDEMRAVLRGMRNLPLHVVMLCHLKLTEDMESNRVYLRPSLQGAVGDEIAGYVDVALAFKAVTTLEVSPDGQSSQRVVHRYAQTYPDPTLPWVRDNSGKLPPEFEVNFTDDFARLYEAVFGGALNLAPSSVIGQVEDPVARELPASGNSHVRVAPTEKAAPAKAAPKAAAKPKPVVVQEPDPLPESEPLVQPAPEQLPEPTEADPTEDAIAEQLAAELTAPSTNGTHEQTTAAQPTANERPPCDVCGGHIESDDQLDLSTLRFRKPLCRTCFIDAKRSPAPAR
jgi:hypothetical protein